ncbi:MAG: Zn-ribbon domain-containing OB-fold protein [Spirochaetes bacterium]|nr:MAG: Zn-ribbon domain-containing OB-fold protein [Spirochaetota bacterium]
MADIFKGVEPLVVKSKISVPYHWWAGETASTFYVTLRDKQAIMGTRCAKCAKLFLPPRKTCPLCFGTEMEWKAVKTAGVVQAFTVVRRQLAAMSKKAPVIYALIKLEGADSGFLHVLDQVRPEDVKIGMRVEAKFAGNRTATIFDIEYFKPASQEK